MRRLQKNKKGFTLLEMVLVIAIIIIIASVVAINAIDIYRKAESGEASIDNEVSSMTNGFNSMEENLRGNHNF